MRAKVLILPIFYMNSSHDLPGRTEKRVTPPRRIPLHHIVVECCSETCKTPLRSMTELKLYYDKNVLLEIRLLQIILYNDKCTYEEDTQLVQCSNFQHNSTHRGTRYDFQPSL